MTTMRAVVSRHALSSVGLALITLYLGLLTWSMQNSSFDIWGGLVVGPALLGVTIPVLLRQSRRDEEGRLAYIVVVACILKLVGAGARYVFAFEIAENADATVYDRIGRQLATAIRAGNFDVDVTYGSFGTRVIARVTGWVYAFIGPTKLGGFLVFSWFGFWGLYLFYRAFRLACPTGAARRYASLVFFLPSMLFWPSSIGKEAIMTLCLGVTAYGVARLFTGGHGFLLVGTGLWGAVMVRPHVAAIVLVGLITGFFFKRSVRAPLFGPASKAVGLGLLLVVGLLIAAQLQSRFDIQGLDTEAATKVLDETERRSSQGGSAFAASRVRSPADLPYAALTVLFRPFPYEVTNVQSLISSLEGIVLLVACVRILRNLRAAGREVMRNPYVMTSAVFTVLFIIAFSSVANFGIIARQRVQVFPFLIVLLAVSVSAKVRPVVNAEP